MNELSELEIRVRELEKTSAVMVNTTTRAEQDLKNIAESVGEIKDVVTKWKGGMGVLFVVGSVMMAVIAAGVEFLTAWLKK